MHHGIPLEEWERVEEKIKSLPQSQKEVKDFTRFVFSNATECELDKQGRILIPPALRERAGISKGVMVVGSSTRWRLGQGGLGSEASQNGDKIGEVLSTLGL